jgi:hypothetical protein
VTLRVAHPPGREPERRYALSMVLEEFLGLDVAYVAEDRDDVEIGGAVRVPDRFLGQRDEDWLTPASLPEAVDEEDVFGTAFLFLTRYEELVRPERDRHGRFTAAAALAPGRPVVNEVVEQLWRRLEAAFPRLERRPRSFELVVSHDVDVPGCRGRRPRVLAADLVRERDPLLAARRLAGRDPCDTFDYLLEASERRGLRSAFYFIADGSEYPLEQTRPLLERIHARGHEIGLHPGYDSQSAEAVRAEADRLRALSPQEPAGGRQHFLRWSPAAWGHWEQAGLAYDSSVGWAEAAGFRAGVCYEYPVFDVLGRRALGLRERPLVAMEATFLQYLALDDEAALATMRGLKDTCRRYGGSFTLLWHNNRLQSARARRLYEAVLDA